MLRNELEQRLGAIDAELSKIASYSHPTNGQVSRTKELLAEGEDVRQQLLDLDAKHERIRATHDRNVADGNTVAGKSFGVHVKPSDDELFRAGRGSTTDNLRGLERALEDAVEITGRSADSRPEIRKIIEDNPNVGDYLRATANPHYRSAFGKLLIAGDPAAAVLKFTENERAAFAAVAEAEGRAALTTANTGGYGVPALLDPSVIVTNDGSANPIRQISRVVTGISDSWSGVSSSGVTASWDSQGVEVDDNSPTMAQPVITAHKAAAFAQFSVELEGDWVGLTNELAMLFGDAKDNLEATAFATGTGDAAWQPTGILTALFNDSVTASTTVTVTTDGQFGAVDVRNVFGALGPRYRPNASWLASIDVMNEIRSLGDDKLGNQTVDLSAPYSFALLGKPVYEASALPDFTATTGVANICAVGDFRNYVVFDRTASMRVELVNHMLGSNRLPNGLRGVYAHWRVGAGSVNSQAFKVLKNL